MIRGIRNPEMFKILELMNYSGMDYFSHCLFSNLILICPIPQFAREFLSMHKLFLVFSLLITSTDTRKQNKDNPLQLQIGYRKMRVCEDLMGTRQGLLEPMNISEE